MNLHNNTTALKELVELSSRHFNLEQSHVEKDYWICKFLSDAANSDFVENIYFKGGTSLSKAFHLIERFSEDLDIFIFTNNKLSSKQAEKTLNRNISHFLMEKNKEIYREELSKTGGDFRKLSFSYDTSFKAIGLKENLEVELKCCTLEDKTKIFYPYEIVKIQSIITEYLTEISRDDIVKKFEIGSTTVRTINPKRTLCDKISRLIRLSCSDGFGNLIAKHIRDVYDIYCILSQPAFTQFLNSPDFGVALKSVIEEDGLLLKKPNINLQNTPMALKSVIEEDGLLLKKPNINLQNTPIFANVKDIFALSEVSKAYNLDLKKLLFDSKKQPTILEIVSCFKEIQNVLQKMKYLWK